MFTTLLKSAALILLGWSLLQAEAAQAEYDWELKREKDGIEVYTRKIEGVAHKAVRASMVIEASLSAAVGLVRDTEVCAEWAELCREAREHEVVSPVELYVYTYNDIPWPVTDRDALTHVIWTQDPETLAVTMSATATTGRMPEIDKAVRIVNATTSWIFTPVGEGMLKVETEALIDPNGPTPAWITNLLLVETPFKTMINLRKVLASGRYDSASFEFITLPEA